MKLYTKAFAPIRCQFLPDGAKSSLHGFVENVLGKTRQFLRNIFRKEVETSNNRYRYQFRLNYDFLANPQPLLERNFALQPSFIQKLISKWPVNSIASSVAKEASRKIARGGPLLCFISFALTKKQSLLTDEEELEGVSFEIREAFSHVPLCKTGESTIDKSSKGVTFEDLKIGDLIAKGCNAAVYSAYWKAKDEVVTTEKQGSPSMSRYESKSIPEKIIMSHSEGDINDMLTNNTKCSEEAEKLIPPIDPFDLAVKVMFNYSAESNAFAIFKAMYKETLPVMTDFSLGQFSGFNIKEKKYLPPHSNIAEMYYAFADRLPLLPGAFSFYPQALPARISSDGYGRNMTLFLVMKRYHCSLKEYLDHYNANSSTALMLLTQLLEALVHLLQNEVAHRDLKTDNVLLDITEGSTSPILAVTDFGCCVEHLKIPHPSDDIDKGGNAALMAPEIVNAVPGTFSYLDYSRADLWTCGTLAYEIFGGSNPFYSSNSSLKNTSYTVTDLPPLPPHTPAVVQKLVRDLLHPDPHLRPRQNLAATVCQLLIHAPSDLLGAPSCKETYSKLFNWMFLMAAKTFLQAKLQPSLSSVEFRLRYTFCSRIQFSEVLEAHKYIVDA